MKICYLVVVVCLLSGGVVHGMETDPTRVKPTLSRPRFGFSPKVLTPEEIFEKAQNDVVAAEEKQSVDRVVLVQEENFLLQQIVDESHSDEMRFQISKAMNIDMGVVTQQHRNASKTAGTFGNEDRYGVACKDGMCGFGMYDGHGGYQISAAAKKYLLDTIIQSLGACSSENEYKEALEKAYTSFDAEYGPESTSGAAAVTAIVKDGNLIVAHAGDSRAILCKASDEGVSISYATRDHSAREALATEIEAIERRDGCISRGRLNGSLAVTRALGDYGDCFGDRSEKMLGLTAEPDVTLISVNECDFAILATDGFWDNYSNEDAAQFVNNALKGARSTGERVSAESIARKLLDKTYDAHDDVTVMVVLFNKQPQSPSLQSASGNVTESMN